MAKNNKRPKKSSKQATKAKSATKLTPAKLDSAWGVSRKSIAIIWGNKGLFSGIMLVYGICYLVLVQGVGGISASKSSFSGSLGKLFSGLGTFSLIFGGSSSTTNPDAGTYQAVLVVVVSLVLIWTLRQVYAGHKVTVKDGYYKALFPFVPFILIILLIGIELLPLVIGSLLFNIVDGQNIAVNLLEKSVGLLFLLGTIYLSLYLISSSIFALYIVTLPDMTPMKALRSARSLVKGRRLLMIRKLLFLPIALVIVSSLILLPFVLIYAPLAAWVLFILSLAVISLAHSYLYTLYRELVR